MTSQWHRTRQDAHGVIWRRRQWPTRRTSRRLGVGLTVGSSSMCRDYNCNRRPHCFVRHHTRPSMHHHLKHFIINILYSSLTCLSNGTRLTNCCRNRREMWQVADIDLPRHCRSIPVTISFFGSCDNDQYDGGAVNDKRWWWWWRRTNLGMGRAPPGEEV